MTVSERSEIRETGPRQEGFGTSRRWTRTIGGQQYSFTAVLMPDGERRYFASKFNGYSGGPRFACAWTPCFEHTVKPQASTTGQLNEDNRFRTFQVLVRDTVTGEQRSIQMHGGSASEIRERATATIGPDDKIDEVRWAD